MDTTTTRPTPTVASGSAGWHRDAHDPTTARHWDGTRWTSTCRWDGHSWVEVAPTPAAPPATEPLAALAARGLGSAAAAARTVADSLPTAALTFKVFVGAAVAMVLGYFVPVGTVSAGPVTETRTLGDYGGFGVLVLAAAAGTVWAAWPARNGRLGFARLAALGATGAVVALFVLATLAAMGTHETDHGYGIVAESTASPSLGLVLLVLAVLAQGAGLALAVLDRVRAGS